MIKEIFFYLDGINFLKIYDKRSLSDIKIFILDNLEREIFLACKDVISLEKIKEQFANLSDQQIITILDTFEKKGILFREDNYFLSLPLKIDALVDKNQEKQHSQIIQISGNELSL